MVYNSRKTRAKDSDDYFETPHGAIDVLYKHIDFTHELNDYEEDCNDRNNYPIATKGNMHIVDLCCGKEEPYAILNYFSNKDHRVFGFDIGAKKFPNIPLTKERDYKDYGVRFNYSDGALIMNPPFNQKNLFIEKSLEFLHTEKQIKIVALLLPLTSLASKGRADIYKKYSPPTHLIINNPRVQFVVGKSSNLDTAWFVWDKRVEFHTNTEIIV